MARMARMAETQERRENNDRFHFDVYPKWRRRGDERRDRGSFEGKGLFRRRLGDRRIGFLARISRYIFPRGFPEDG